MLLGLTALPRSAWLVAVVMFAQASAAAQARATTVRLMSSGPCKGTIESRTACGEPSCFSAILQFTAPGEMDLFSEIGKPLRVLIQGDTCWGSAEVRAGTEPTSVQLYPGSTLKGRLELPHGITPPLAVSASIARQPDHLPGFASTDTRCTFRDRTWSCAVPIGQLDLRLEIPGFAPEYRWGLSVAAEGLDIGTLRMVPGGSVAGWVLAPKQGDLRSTSAKLYPSSVSGRIPQTQKGTITPRGFFQFKGVAPGAYRIEIRYAGYSPSVGEIGVNEPREYRLRRDLVLERLAELTVMTDPVPPDSGEWKVRLQRDEGGGRLTRIAEGPLSERGWFHAGLDRVQYVLTIIDSAGNTRHREVVPPDRLDALLQIRIDSVRVRGTLSVGDEGLAAALRLMGADGTSVSMTSDSDGKFDGILPHEGRWRVSITPDKLRLRVRSAPITVRRGDSGIATVDIRLPAGKIKGRVRNESGAPVSSAEILAVGEDEPAGNAGSDQNGYFELIGLNDGVVRVQAVTREGESSVVPVHVTANDTAEIELTLRPRITVRGRIVTSDGQPVSGALIKANPAGFGPSIEESSGSIGEFSFRAAAGSPIDLVVLSPGFGVKLDRYDPAVNSLPLRIVLDRSTATLNVRVRRSPPWPSITSGNVSVPLPALLQPVLAGQTPEELREGGFTFSVQPGRYTVCSGTACAETVCYAGAACEVNTDQAGGP